MGALFHFPKFVDHFVVLLVKKILLGRFLQILYDCHILAVKYVRRTFFNAFAILCEQCAHEVSLVDEWYKLFAFAAIDWGLLEYFGKHDSSYILLILMISLWLRNYVLGQNAFLVGLALA